MTAPRLPDSEALRFEVKGQLRKRMRALRRTLPEEARAARAQAACARVLDMEAFDRARSVLGYVAIRGELDPHAVLGAARAQGKRVVLPRVASTPDAPVPTLSLHRYDGEPLEPGAFGVPEPPPDTPSVAPDSVDFVLVPALAVDPLGYRIGYGKGFYDRLLACMPSAFSVGMAYDFQLISEVPRTAGDVPVRVVVTDRRVIHPSAE